MMERGGIVTRALLFVLVWLSVAWFGSWELNPNNAVRMFAAVSLVEDGDATIDQFAPLTIDKATFGAHAYLDKAPGMTLMALPAVAAVNASSGWRSADVGMAPGAPDMAHFLRARQWAAVATGPAVLTALAAVLLYDIGLGLTGRAGAALFGALGYALGSPIWGWSGTLLGHATVAAMYVVAAWCFLRPPRWSTALLGGMALGWAVVVEYQAALAGSAIAIWAVLRWWGTVEGRRAIVVAAIGGVAALLPLAAYNIVAFGTPFRVGYSGVVGFEGMNQGLFGLTWPRPMVLLEILLGDRRGLFWFAPVLLMAPLGLAALADERPTRGLAIMAAAAAAIVPLGNASYFYWDGGNSTGPRHAMPAVALLAIGLAPWWASLRSTAARVGGAVLLGGSIAINAVIAAADVFAPPEVRYPFWRYVVERRFWPGDLTTFPSEWLGWTRWTGFWSWAAVATVLLALLVVRVRRGSA